MHVPLWIREAKALEDEERPLPPRAEAVVIGGGLAGVSVALHLARGGIRPVLLEAGAVACRASGRNDGQLLLGLGEHYNRIVGQFGVERARRLWTFLRENNRLLLEELRRAGIDCALRQCGGLRLAETEHEYEELRQAASLLRAEGIPHRLHSKAEVERLLPAVAYHGGLELEGEAILQPVDLVRGLARQARLEGARIYQHHEVLAVAGEAGAFRLRTASGEVEAPILVHCSSALAPALDGSGFLSTRVFPYRGQILASELLPEAISRRFPEYAMSSHFCYEYFRRHGRRLLIGGMRWSVPGEEQGILDDSAVHAGVSERLLHYVARHFPLLEGKAFPLAWSGIMAGTPDGLPLLGNLPGLPGVFALLGFNGYGLSFAFLGAQVLAEQILDGQSQNPTAEMFAPRRLR